ncbi:carbohydrate ABC transporter substrate-binding protein [Paenibacillus sp. B2(2019)]|nr:carbohydrate ABC transporter substrate-binding protein [Paenibacillus sp. B2(2019)]
MKSIHKRGTFEVKKNLRTTFSKALTGVMLTSLGLSLLTGCGESSNTGTSTSNVSGAKKTDVTLSVMASAGWIRDVDKKLAEKFKEQTGIKIDFQENPGDQYENVLMTRLATGEGPDIFMAESGLSLLKVQPNKYAVDLSNESWVSKYPDYAKVQASYDNKVVGFTTWGRDFSAMLYNTEIFEKYDLKEPTSYEEFKQVSEKLLENGITPVYFPGKEEWYNAQAFDAAVNIESKATGSYEKLNNNTMKYAESEEALKYLRNLKDSADNGYFGENFLSDTYDQGIAGLASGKYAMWQGWSTYVNDIEAAGGPSADKFLAFPAPYGDDLKTLAMNGTGMTHLINKDSKNIDAAKQYFEFLAEPENLQEYYDGRPDLLEPTLEGATANPPANYKHVLKTVNDKTLLTLPQSILYNGADGSLGKNVQSMFFNMMTPEQVLQSLDAARAKMFDATK